MSHLHRNVIAIAMLDLALVAGAYALLGVGFAAMVAIGLFAVSAFVLAGAVVFEEETRLPAWRTRR